MSGENGSGVVLAMVVVSTLTALGLGLVVVSATERAIAGNHHAGVQALYGAEAVAEYVLTELRSDASWTPALSGERRSTFLEPTSQPMAPWNAIVDLTTMTAQVQQHSDAFWSAGFDTPQWQVFAAGAFETITGLDNAGRLFLTAWVADDTADGDADPGVDSNGIVMIRTQALGLAGLRRSLLIVLRREDPGTEVVSWKEVR
jgi:hypothetical protein